MNSGAPATTCSGTDCPAKLGTAFAMSMWLIRFASSRGAPRTVSGNGKQPARSRGSSHRRKVSHVRSAAAPTVRQGLIRRRTSRLEARSVPYSENAHATAGSENSR